MFSNNNTASNSRKGRSSSVEYNQKAITSLSETLRQCSDIEENLENLELESKELYEAHQEKLHKKISTSYQEFKEIDAGFKVLEHNITKYPKLREQNIQILKGFRRQIKDYKTISTVCEAHKRFHDVDELINRLSQISEEDIPEKDILKYHDKIFQLEEFGFELRHYNVELNPMDTELIENTLAAIKKKSIDFRVVLMEKINNLFIYCDEVEKINQIVRKEENRDKLISQAIEGEKGNDPVKKKVTEMYPKYVSGQVKKLKETLISVIKSSIKTKFIFKDKKFIKHLDFVLDDLTFIKEKISLDFFTFDSFLLLYHQNLKNGISQNLSSIDSSEILKLIEFRDAYYYTIETRFNKVAESLGSRLIDRESELLEKYAKVASDKLKSWIDNIAETEISRFRSRDKDIGTDEDDKLVSSGFINLLQLIQLKIEPIRFNSSVFSYISKTIHQHCISFKEKICRAIETDFLLTCKGKTDPGFEDYCIMFGNSGLKLTQYISSLPHYQSDEIQGLGDTFIAILKTVNHFLSEFVILTCKPAIDEFFTEKWKESFGVFLTTLNDFLSDYRVVMIDFAFTTFCNELCKSISDSYLKKLCSKHIDITEKTGNKLRRNHSKLLEIFNKYIPSDNIEDRLSPLLKIIPLFSVTNIEMITLEIKSIIMSCDNIQKKMIINIFSKRHNIPEKVKKSVLELISSIFEETEIQKQKLINA